jgi:glycosyltransferase involved in cell wall biosynthesis
LNKKILIAASNYWTSPYQVGSHHYARLFAKNGWEVLFISDPISPLHFLMKNKNQLKERYSIYKGEISSGTSNIKIYVPMALITPNEKPLFNSNFAAFKWSKLTFPNLKKYIENAGFGEVDILWFDSVLQSSLIDEIKYTKSILRLADRIESFKKISPGLIKAADKLKDKADIIIYAAKSLEDYVKNYKTKSFFVPNGVDFSHFLGGSAGFVPEDLKSIPKPIAIYIGAINEWFGFDLLFDVCKKCYDVSFIIIGEPSVDISKLKDLPNIYFLGKKPYNSIPDYLYNSDVGIIPFNINHPVVDTVNPIKLYEYMACGLPVVSVFWQELKLLSSPAFLAGSADDFAAKIYGATSSGKKEEYIDFAKKNSWDKRIEEIIRIYNN